MMTGTHRARNLSAWARPPRAPSARVVSWPSLHRFGARKENAGVALARAVARMPTPRWTAFPRALNAANYERVGERLE